MGGNNVKLELELLLKQLKEVAEERHNEGVGLRDVSGELSEWNYGYAEGLDYAIERLETMLNQL